MADAQQLTNQMAVIDRFEGNTAVLLVGEARRVMNVLRDALPAEAREGMWLKVALEGGMLKQAALDEDATEAARQRIQEKLDRLRRGDHLRS
jgi:hypothetical protein